MYALLIINIMAVCLSGSSCLVQNSLPNFVLESSFLTVELL